MNNDMSGSDGRDNDQKVRDAGKEWTGQLSQEEYDSLRDYSKEEGDNSTYKNINNTLRGYDHFVGDNYQNAVNIHNALSRSEMPCDCVCYRGGTIDILGIYADLPDESLVGKHFKDFGFMSTSLSLEAASRFEDGLMLEISVPKGANGSYLGDLSVYGGVEDEVLFDCYQELCITGAETDANGVKVLKVKLLPKMKEEA